MLKSGVKEEANYKVWVLSKAMGLWKRACYDHSSLSCCCNRRRKLNLPPLLMLVNEYFMRTSQAAAAFVDSIDRYVVLEMVLMV